MSSATQPSSRSPSQSRSIRGEIQEYILDKLRQIKARSVLQIGCGEGEILECLMRCSDDIPVAMLGGVDKSEYFLERAGKSMERASKTDQQVYSRWRDLEVNLIQGYPTVYQSD